MLKSLSEVLFLEMRLLFNFKPQSDCRYYYTNGTAPNKAEGYEHPFPDKIIFLKSPVTLYVILFQTELGIFTSFPASIFGFNIEQLEYE